MSPIVGVLLSYLAGSLPSAYIAGKLRGVDLRKHGSGNLGATNVARVLGAKTGAVVFLADLLKGFLPVYFLSNTLIQRTGSCGPSCTALRQSSVT